MAEASPYRVEFVKRYVAEFPMRDTEGVEVATGRVTVKLLSHDWG